MSEYAAAACLKYIMSYVLRIYDVLLPAPTLRTYELVLKELESFLVVVERMESRSRKMMSNSLEKIGEAIREAEEAFGSNNIYKDFVVGVKLVDSLRRTKEEYYSIVGDGDEGSSSRSKSNIVGLREERIRLKEEILNYKWGKRVVTIFGMVGIGKTTLAREIFQDLDISEWFDCRAWVTVGTEWNSEQVTRAILTQTGGYHYQEEETDLKQWLEGKRCLIVLDNIWNSSIEESMESYVITSFPDSKNGSRILITSRIMIKGSFGSFLFLPFEKRLLNKEESWHLLCDKVFAGGSCPPQLVEPGKKIADKCDGLPLAILTVADLLSKAEDTPESLWIHVAEQKKHPLFIDAYDRISEVLYPSFKELHDILKPCFVYMGVFPLKYEISATKLINLWIAEELVEPSMASTLEIPLESIAAVFLQLLDLNCLIKVHLNSTSSSPSDLSLKIKTCSLHSSWWHFCQREAKKTDFFYALDSYRDGLEEGTHCQGRLSLHNNVLFALKDVYSSIEENCASTAQSLLCFGPYHQYMVPICFGLKLLVRLDALNIRLYEFPIEVIELVMLRYLALTCNGKLPPSVSKLGKLEYLIVHRHASIKSFGGVSNFPVEIWDMEMLKYLRVEGSDLPDLDDASLHNLSALLGVSISSCAVLKRVPNLKKLGIKIELRPDGRVPFYFFDHFSHLSELESLKCVIMNPEWKYEVVSPVASLRCLPFSLKKVSLSGLGCPWEEISCIASLPNLKTLKLRYNAFRGPKCEVEENGFQKLRYLLMEDIDVVALKWASGSFKSLENFRIAHCYKLKEVHMSNLPSILRIEMVDSNPLAERGIKESIFLNNLTILDLHMHYSWKSRTENWNTRSVHDSAVSILAGR